MRNKHYILSIIIVLFSACGSSSDSTTTTTDSNVTSTETNSTTDTDSTSKVAYTPATISSMLEANQTVSWEVLESTPSNLTHFSMSELDNNDIIVLSDSNTSVDAALNVDTDMKTETSITATRLLNGLFEFVETSTSGTYYITSLKHSNYALDIASSSSDVLTLRDFRSGSKDTSSSAYLLFTVTNLYFNSNRTYDI